ncbi:MAG TPA: hypothetical protein VHP30_00480, partial [Ignavibacteriales bacterium]|nr:hypothetical protein [Ignavibacteriales bacterium]
MRFLKNILLAAALSLACISCEDESVGPERDPFYDPNDLVGTDIGASITESYFVLSTSHSGNFENDNSDQYYYGFWAEFRLSDSSKCDIIDSVSITLSDGGSEIKRYKFSVGKYSYGYIGSTPILSRYYMHHYPSGAQPINYISPRYSCKVRLYNHNNDSTKAHTLNINTENYIKPGVSSCRWINSSDLEISLKEWSLTQNNNYGLLSYYSKDHKFLSFLTLDMSDFGNSFYIHGVPNDAAYYKIHLQDNYSGIDRQFEGKVIPLPQRNLGSATQVSAIKNINFIEYIKNLNKLVLVSSGSKEIALIDASSYETVWKKTL